MDTIAIEKHEELMKEQREEEFDCPKTHRAGKTVLKSL